MSTQSINSQCVHKCHLFSAPLCKEQTPLRRVANLVFHIFTLALPLLIYHLCRCCCALDCTRVQVAEQDPEDVPPDGEDWAQYRENLIASLQQSSMVMENADPRWKKDEAIVIAYLQKEPTLAGEIFARHVDLELHKNKNVVLAMVQCNGRALRLVYFFQNDKQVVLAAVQQDGLALCSAHESLKGDKDVVLTAVRQNGTALRDASEPLKKDREVVIAAALQGGHNPSPYVLRWARGLSEEDKEAVIAALPEHYRAEARDCLYQAVV